LPATATRVGSGPWVMMTVLDLLLFAFGNVARLAAISSIFCVPSECDSA
jgi:hypothetical protein